jgi:thymidine kinase
MDMKVLYINSVLDTRSDSVFSTHNITIGKIPFDGFKLKELKGYDVGEYDVIAVDEAQFFDDQLIEVTAQLAKMGKRVIIAGLDMDYLGKPYGPMPGLLATANFITKFFSINL